MIFADDKNIVLSPQQMVRSRPLIPNRIHKSDIFMSKNSVPIAFDIYISMKKANEYPVDGLAVYIPQVLLCQNALDVQFLPVNRRRRSS